MGSSSLFGSDSDSASEVEPESTFPSPRALNTSSSSCFSRPQGLYHFPLALPPELEKVLIDGITSTLPLSPEQDQLMYFSHLPLALTPLLGYLFGNDDDDESSCYLSSLDLPSQVLHDLMDNSRGRRQAIVNLYLPGQGITPHVDLPDRYSDVVLGVSLISSTIMQFTCLEDRSKTYELTLRPRDIYILSGEARDAWEHGIEGRHEDVVDGEVRRRGTRISVTLRRMKEGGDVVGDDGSFTVSPRTKA